MPAPAATMTAAATAATTEVTTTTRGCRPRFRRGTGNGLHALLAAIAIVPRLLRILYADEGTIRFRPADRRGTFHWCGRGMVNIHRTINWLRCRTFVLLHHGMLGLLHSRAIVSLHLGMGQLLPDGRRSLLTGKSISAITPVAPVGGDCARMTVWPPDTGMPHVPPA